MAGREGKVGAVLGRVALAGILVVVLAACRAPAPGRAEPPAPTQAPGRVARGAALYDAYCAGCHGVDGGGDGQVAAVLNLRPTDLRSPGLVAGASESEIVERLVAGTPLHTAPRPNAFAEDRQVSLLADYIVTLSTRDWARIRAGRLVYEAACAACHGGYGTGEGILGGLLTRSPGNLQTASAHYTDAALAGIVRDGLGAMPPMDEMLDPGETRAVIAYVRLLSPAYRLYETYCAGCHGDDGRGVHPEDLLPPATAAPPLHSATLAGLRESERREKVLHMFRRERGMMPHFRDTLAAAQLGDIAAYLRTRFH